MIADTLELVARTTSSAARRLPVAGRLFGRVPRLELEGRVVFITGAARGLGAEIARRPTAAALTSRSSAAGGRRLRRWRPSSATAPRPSRPTSAISRRSHGPPRRPSNASAASTSWWPTPASPRRPTPS